MNFVSWIWLPFWLKMCFPGRSGPTFFYKIIKKLLYKYYLSFVVQTQKRSPESSESTSQQSRKLLGGLWWTPDPRQSQCGPLFLSKDLPAMPCWLRAWRWYLYDWWSWLELTVPWSRSNWPSLLFAILVIGAKGLLQYFPSLVFRSLMMNTNTPNQT